jgi:WD40 repeat protein
VRFFDTKTGQSAGTHSGKSSSLALAFLSDGELVAARNPDPIKVRVTRDDAPTPATNQEHQRPEFLTAARRLGNLLVDGSFEEIPSKQWVPRSWRMNLGAATVVSDTSKLGKAAAMLRPTEMDDCMLVQKVAVKAGTQYLLSGWVRTKDVTIEQGGRLGANLSVVGGFEASRSVVGTNDWEYVWLVFDTRDRKEIEVGARLGHNGSVAKGTAWFDDMVLLELSAANLPEPLGKSKMDPKVDVKSPAETANEQKGGMLKESESLSDTIVSCTFSTDGKKIYACTHQGVVHVLDAANLDETVKFEVAKSRISQMVLKPKTVLPSGTTAPERLYLLDDTKQVQIWDAEKRTQVRKFSLDKVMAKIDSLELMVVTPTESYLMGFDADRGSSISWDLVRGAPGILSSLSRAPFVSATRCVAFTPDCKIGTAYASGKLLVWNVQTGADIRIIDAVNAPTWVGLLPAAGSVISAGRNHLQAWSYTSTGKQTLDVRDPHGRGGFANFHAAVSSKGDRVATAGNDRWLRIWDVRKAVETAKWQMDREPKGIAMSPDGKFAVIWHEVENKISLWGVGQMADEKK